MSLNLGGGYLRNLEDIHVFVHKKKRQCLKLEGRFLLCSFGDIFKLANDICFLY